MSDLMFVCLFILQVGGAGLFAYTVHAILTYITIPPPRPSFIHHFIHHLDMEQ